MERRCGSLGREALCYFIRKEQIVSQDPRVTHDTLVFAGTCCYKHIVPYETEEGFWHIHGFYLRSGSVAMQIASGRVRRKTEPTGPGDREGCFFKIDTYGAFSKRTYQKIGIGSKVQGTVFISACEGVSWMTGMT